MNWSFGEDDKVLCKILGTIIEDLLQTLPKSSAWRDFPPNTSFAEKHPDIYASRTILNIDLKYSRVIPDRNIVSDYAKKLVYIMKTKSWSLTYTRPLLIDPDNKVEHFRWIGYGDHEQWKHDFALLRLFGYADT